MRSLLIAVSLLATALFAQELIPAGTVLPVRLNTSLDSQKSKSGQVMTARIMQDVPLPDGGKIPARAKVIGHIISVTPAATGRSAMISLQFDTVKFGSHSLTVITNLRALASMMEVEDAQVPPTGTDRGTPWAWMTTHQVGGEVVYGQGGPVTHGSQVVGEAAPGGVLARLSAKPGTSCRGAIEGDRPQALWIFSSDACGTYGFSDLEIAHAGRTAPLGQITLISKQARIHVPGGSGLLLRVNAR
jgi:hypothetical protein